MSFLNPLIAAVGLGCVTLPILIHILLRRRRKPIAFGAMRFLIEAYRQQRRRMRFEQLLLLALRCLLVALVAMALGKPIFDRAGALASNGPRTVYVLVDDSMASAIRADASSLESPTSLDTLRDSGLKVLDALNPSRGDRVALISLSGPARGIILPPTSDVNVARDSLRELSPTDARADLPGAIDLVRQDIAAREDKSGVTVVLLSEFRAASLSTNQTLASLGDARIVASTPADLGVDNLAITAIEPLRTIVVADARSIPVRVTVSRSGPGLDSPATARVRLRASIAGAPSRDASTTTTPLPPIDARFAAGQQVATALGSVDAPAQTPDARGNLRPVIIEVSLDHDALARDDAARVALQSRTAIDVAIIWPGVLGLSSGQARGVADLTPGDWLALAAAPVDDPLAPRRASGDVRLFVLDPVRDLTGPAASTALRGIDAAFVPAPDALDAAAWSLLRAATEAGALVIVSPPSGEADPAWTRALADAFDIRATIAPAPTALDLPTNMTIPAASSGGGTDLLSMIAGELPELLRPVTVSRFTPVTGPAGSFDTLLTLESGQPILSALSTGGTKSDAATNAPAATSAASRAPSRASGLVLFLGVAPDLNWSDMPAKPLMVPLVQELLRQGVGRAMMTRVATAGSRVAVEAREGELIALPLTTDDPRAGQLLDAAVPIRTAGLYAVRTSDAATARVIVVNPDTAASVTDTQTADAVQRALATVAPTVEFLAPQAAPANPGTAPSTAPNSAPTTTPTALAPESTSPPISYPLLIAAGVIALIELILARLFSHATIARESSDPASSSTPTPPTASPTSSMSPAT